MARWIKGVQCRTDAKYKCCNTFILNRSNSCVRTKIKNNYNNQEISRTQFAWSVAHIQHNYGNWFPQMIITILKFCIQLFHFILVKSDSKNIISTMRYCTSVTHYRFSIKSMPPSSKRKYCASHFSKFISHSTLN